MLVKENGEDLSFLKDYCQVSIELAVVVVVVVGCG